MKAKTAFVFVDHGSLPKIILTLALILGLRSSVVMAQSTQVSTPGTIPEIDTGEIRTLPGRDIDRIRVRDSQNRDPSSSKATVNEETCLLPPLNLINNPTIPAEQLQLAAEARKDYHEACAALKGKKSADAEKHLRKALKHHPKYSAAWVTLGQVLAAQERNVEARSACLRSSIVDPTYVPAYLCLADIAAHAGAWNEVLTLSGRALELDPSNNAVSYEYQAAANLKIHNLAAAEQLLAPVNKNSASPLNITKLGDFCDRIYFPHVRDSKRPSTVRGYRQMWSNYVKPRYEAVWMREVRTRDVQAWLEEIAREHKLSRTTLRHVKHLLSGVFRYAAQQDYLDSGRNPVTLASIPVFAPSGEEGKAYSLEEIGAMLKVLSEPANTIIACAAYTGLRLGELRGLTWEAYSPASEEDSLGSLFVTRSVWRSLIGEPKTKKSKAPVPVIPQLAEQLDEFRVSNGNPLNGPIFANSLGRPLDLDAFYRRQIQDVFKRAGIQWVGWHGFRRGLASNLNRLGVDDSVIQAILRHSTVSITQACYIKTARPEAVAAMRLLSVALKNSNCAPYCAPDKERRTRIVVQ